MPLNLSDNEDEAGSDTELLSSSQVYILPSPLQPPLKTRVIIFSAAISGIFAEYLYFTVPMSFLTNEILEKRNQSSTVAGTVYGAMCLSLFITLGLAPKTSELLSNRQTILIGMLLAPLSTVLFAVDLSDKSWVIYSIVSRILQGIAIGLTEIHFMDMMTRCFPDNLALITSGFELAFSLSLMVGSELGGFLYDKFGFSVPLNVTTIIVILSFLSTYICSYWLPAQNHPSTSSLDKDSSSLKDAYFFWPVLVLIVFVMGTVSITDSISMSFFSNYMLTEFQLTETNSGWILTVASLFYSLFTFLSGLMGSRKQNLKFLMIVGLTLMGIGSCFLGKDVFGGFTQNMGIYFPATMLSLLQIGSGLTQVATLPLMVGHYMSKTGLPENIASCHMGGIYSSSFFLGSFLGPILGGYLISISSYGTSCTVAGGINLLSVMVILGLHILTRTLLFPWGQNERLYLLNSRDSSDLCGWD